MRRKPQSRAEAADISENFWKETEKRNEKSHLPVDLRAAGFFYTGPEDGNRIIHTGTGRENGGIRHGKENEQ
jgi:hypothetical protein